MIITPRVVLAGWIPVISILPLVVSLTTVCSYASNASGLSTQEKGDRAAHERKLGIRILSLRPTAADHLLDLRFRVIDPVKAAHVLDSDKRAYIIDQASGRTLPVPVTRLGPMRQATLKPQVGRVYFILFSNGQGLVEEGDKVTLVIGDLRVEDITVEGIRVQRTTNNRRPSELSEEKRRRWKSVQNVVRHEYEVCVEHCGKDPNCLVRCDNAYEARLDGEYQRLIHE